MPRDKVSPLGIELLVEGNGGEQAELEGEARVELLKGLPRAAVAFRGMGANEVAIERLERSLGEEIEAAAKGLAVEELLFEEARDGLDITRVGVRGRGDALVWGAKESEGWGGSHRGSQGAGVLR